MDSNQFLQSHGSQLQRIPQIYWEALYKKLCAEVYDAGSHFTMNHDECGWKVHVSNKEGLTKDNPNNVFLVDHAWTFQSPNVRHLLATIPGLANRMAVLMDVVQLPSGGGEEEEEGNSYDGDSESGNEESSPSSCEDVQASPVDQSHFSMTIPPVTVTTSDGYTSGDLGDESYAHITEGTRSTSDSSSDHTPPQSFRERYKIAQLEEKVEELSVDSSNQIAEQPSNEIIEEITCRMWSYCHAYHINNSSLPIWYIMDEFGSRVRQSCDPTVAMTVFFYIPSQLAFTVIWPLKTLSCGDEVTCNFVPSAVSTENELEYWCHSLPWSGVDPTQREDWSGIENFNTPQPTERCDEVYTLSAPSPPHKPCYTVYTDIKVIQSFLTTPEFKLVNSPDEADILWPSEHFKQFQSLQSHQFVNQFPCENMLTCKDLLVLVAQRGGTTPSWLPLTFNLLYELPKLVKCYTDKKKCGELVWIVKPWNLGRGLGITVTDNLLEIIRLAQVGPKIASRYISNPVLFNRDDVGWVKFDVRYIVLLKSVSPLELYVYDVFWLRFANKPFSLSNFHDYDKHFTVMNYTQGGTKLKQIHDVDFVPLFESMYPHIPWSTVQDKMYSVIKELFRAAVNGQPPAALAPCNQSRAMYGLDLMLEWGAEGEIKPQLLEVNYCPDCVRACKYHPQFFNHVFQTLFDIPGASPPVTRVL